MKALWNIFVKNLSNIMSLIGILLSVYFGVYYVPVWLEDAEKQKFYNAQASLEQSIKELIFSDSTCNYAEIQSLVKSKEIILNKNYPLSTEQIMIKVEASFMDDKFLPLVKRRQLIAESQLIRKTIPPNINKVEKKKSSLPLLGWVSIIFTITSTFAAIYGYYLRYLKEKETQEEINNQVSQVEAEFTVSRNGFAFESEIVRALQNYPGIEMVRQNEHMDWGFDIEFIYQGRTIYVEVKYLTSSKIGLASIQKFFHRQKGKQGEFWFVHNNELTKMSQHKFEELNQISGSARRCKLIQTSSAADFTKKLNTLLH
ncbi:restriction endonuclease [Pedobacter helvus]|uniref:Restriction endonuclease n=1 Tax=Pedobacter helvus TaxID=2563444 RepID=A0ABW9JR86_9SPHI|nr:restriction endonuclease [Pedobacter ureilyticus]